MLFGERLLLIRKSKKISQDELAKRLGVHAPIIGRYERAEVKPSIDVATKIAEILEVSLDYLVGLSDQQLDTDIVKHINQLQTLNQEDQNHILKTFKALIREANARKAFAS